MNAVKNVFHALIVAAIAACAVSGVAQQRYSIADEDAMGPGSPRVVVLRDSIAGAEAAVAPSEGADLSSLKITYDGQQIELLYNARNYALPPGAFTGRGPVLWPAVGAQFPVGTVPKESCGMGSYLVARVTYPMPCHGFAKSLPWKEVVRKADQRSARVTLQLRDSDATRKYYPFAFHLDATFELREGLLTVTYIVESDAGNKAPMPFAIGNHLSFNVPLVKGGDASAMKFETPSGLQMLRNAAGTLSGESNPRSFSPSVPLGSFDAHVALPMAGYKHPVFARLTDPTGLSVRVTQSAGTTLPEPLIRFNLYGGARQGYFCPEPWFGVQNSLNTGVGVVKLQPGASWQWQFTVEVERSQVR
jgi:Galactose mutarotase and related enzymes